MRPERTPHRLHWPVAAAGLAVLMFATAGWARYLTHVTATVKDVAGNPYAGGSGNISLVVPAGADQAPKVHDCDTGGPGSTFQTAYSITKLDSFGAFALDLPDNACTTPAGTKWRFSLCDASGKICFTADLTITGPSLDITSQLQATAAPLGTVLAGVVPGHLIPATSGFDLGSATQRWDGFFADLSVSAPVTSTVATGTPPLVVASTTEVANLNADLIGGVQLTGTPTVGQIPVATSGTAAAWNTPTPDGARVYNSAGLTIAHNTLTALTFDGERYDNGGLHSTASNTSRLTAQKAGKYLVTGHVTWGPNATGLRVLRIRLNGTRYLAEELENATGSTGTEMSVATVDHLDAGDYVELLVIQTSGGNLAASGPAALGPEFAMQWLGP